MLALDAKALEKRAKKFYVKVFKNTTETVTVAMVPGHSAVGGGSGPNVHPPTTLIALKHEHLTADQIEQKLRLSSPPVIARIADDLVLLDLRTVSPSEEVELFDAVIALDV
jgi:L-seryl-tRNA(Ser) seleniumtransferase